MRKYQYAENASKFHKKVGDILRSSPVLKHHGVIQEYPVTLVNKLVTDGRLKFDWVILKLKIVIELHGKQHYHVTSFGGESDEEAVSKFNAQKYRDSLKRQAAITAGWRYLEIPYSLEKVIDEAMILRLINEATWVEDLTEDVETRYEKSLRLKREWNKKCYKENKDAKSRAKAL